MARNLFCIFFAGFWTLLLVPCAVITMIVTLNPGASIWWARHVWSPGLLWAGGAKLIVEGREHVDPKRPTIYVSNHQSTIDIPALFVAIPADLRFVAKKALRYVPFLGWYMWLAGYVFVDRGNRRQAIASLDAAGARIRNGVSIVVYPEGTRSHDGSVLPFKKGPFALALKAGVPICPVAIEGSAKLMPKNRWTITPGPIRVKIGAPINVSAYAESEREKLIRDVRDAIITQQVALGGPGGDRSVSVAAAGLEGIGAADRLPSRDDDDTRKPPGGSAVAS